MAGQGWLALFPEGTQDGNVIIYSRSVNASIFLMFDFNSIKSTQVTFMIFISLNFEGCSLEFTQYHYDHKPCIFTSFQIGTSKFQ